jgi:hypothetical protein
LLDKLLIEVGKLSLGSEKKLDFIFGVLFEELFGESLSDIFL